MVPNPGGMAMQENLLASRSYIYMLDCDLLNLAGGCVARSQNVVQRCLLNQKSYQSNLVEGLGEALEPTCDLKTLPSRMWAACIVPIPFSML